MTTAFSHKLTSKILPKGWRWAKLGEVCERRTGIRDPRLEPDSAFQYVDITSVSNVQKSITEARVILGKDAPSRARQVIRVNDVIVATTRPNLNAVAQVPVELDNQICSTGFCVLRAGPEILSDYLFAFVRHDSFIEALTDLVKGALYPAVNDGQVMAQPLPLPPLAEQQRIVEMLREKMMMVEKTRAAVQAQLEATMALPVAFARETLRTVQIRKYRLGDCLTETKHGVGPDWSKYPVLGATRGGLAPAKEGVGKAPERYKLVDPVTVFYNPMRILLGSIAMVDEGNMTGITSPDYVVVKGRPDILDTRWFYYWFRSTHGAHLIDSLSRGAVRERILFNRLAAGEIEIPDYETQLRVSERMKQVKPIVEIIAKELQTIDALPSAILREVFTGAT
jgi:type I restriction enzyme S subunit